VPTATRTRTDLYTLLGVGASASGDEIARAFRARAKQLHPDRSDAPDSAARFNDLVRAYGVLSNHRTRREYDQSCAEVADGALVGRSGGARLVSDPAVSTARSAPIGSRWSRRRAWTAVVAGALVALLGLGLAVLTWELHQSDARQHARFSPVTASRVGNGDVAFITASGQTVETREPEQHGEGSDLGPTVRIRYDPTNPTHVIVDANSVGRDITFAIVALKLLIGGPVFVVLGVRRLRSNA
jgi:DnaJ domain